MINNCENIHSGADFRLRILGLLAVTLATACDYTVTIENGKVYVKDSEEKVSESPSSSQSPDVIEAKSGGDDAIPFCKKLRGHSAPSTPPSLGGREAEGKVVCIVDGDTFDVKLDDGRMVRTRLWGVDCAESSRNEKCMKNGSGNCADEMKRGKSASQKVRQILNDNKRVTLEPPYKNNGNRLLAYVRLQNGIDLGRQLVTKCLCEGEYDHKRKKDYQKAAHNCSR